MSEEIAEKRKLEEKEFEHQESEDKKLISGDICPMCGTRPTAYPYICFLPSPYGWIECVSCGLIYAPKSIRDQKIAAKQRLIERPNIILADNLGS